MKTKILIILIVLIGLGVGGFFICKNLIFPEKEAEVPPVVEEKVEEEEEIIEKEKVPASEEIAIPEKQPLVEFRLVRKIEVANGGYPGIIFANNHFYVSYQWGPLAYIKVKVYDKNFSATGEEHQLTGGEGVDYQMVYGDGYFYLVNSFYLRKFDSDWNEIKSVSIFDNLPPETDQFLSPEGKEGIDDMFLYYTNGSLYIGMIGNMQYAPERKKLDLPENLFIREYNQNLELKSEVMLKDVGNVPGSSMLFQNGTFTIVCSDKKWDDSSLIVVRYDKNWNLIDKKIISAVPNANEEFAMGLLFENGLYFVSYLYITGDLFQPIAREPIHRADVMLKAFDSNWTLMGQTMVTDDAITLSGHPRASRLAWMGNKIYVTYDSTEIDGIQKIFVKEYEIIYKFE